MTFEMCWLVIAPAALLGLSGIGWAGLWIARPPGATPAKAKSRRATSAPRQDDQEAKGSTTCDWRYYE
jgi:hypothetical protein